VLPVVGELERVLAPLDARPHWGKIFTTSPETIHELWDRFADFQDLVRRYDPAGTFRNTWLADLLE
jgi:xylitol oxidase